MNHFCAYVVPASIAVAESVVDIVAAAARSLAWMAMDKDAVVHPPGRFRQVEGVVADILARTVDRAVGKADSMVDCQEV